MKPLPYHKQLAHIIEEIEQDRARGVCTKKPSLLLHACCGPCSSYVIEYLASTFDITIFYYNPNIHPEAEYRRRLAELQKFLAEFPDAVRNNVHLVIDTYNPEDYYTATNVRQETALQAEAEKGERCRRCYEFRMRRAAGYARAHNFDWFTTTLSISPHKDAEKINGIGGALGAEHGANGTTARYLPADFKKNGGFLRSTELSREYGLWRQDYCGCIFSMRRTAQENSPTE